MAGLQAKATISEFLGIGAQHQNVQAERVIKTIMDVACSFLIHRPLHWTEHEVDSLASWSFAVKHAAWIYNHVLNQVRGFMPMEF